VLSRDSGLCQYCGGTATTLDHVMPVSRGGAWSWNNLVAACGRCNAKKGAKTPAEARMTLARAPKEPTAKGAIFTRLGLTTPAQRAATPPQWDGYLDVGRGV
jgi:5-methylcytosine-specific restriction endonuclease McrA